VIRIKSEALQPGMVVAREVKNIDGMLLVPAGCELTERQINILQAWGVVEVDVESSAQIAQAHDPLAQLPPETVARLTAELRARYWKPDEFGPVPAEIFRLMLLRQARRLLHIAS
jgi:molybdopterin biosynthesis enzyme